MRVGRSNVIVFLIAIAVFYGFLGYVLVHHGWLVRVLTLVSVCSGIALHGLTISWFRRRPDGNRWIWLPIAIIVGVSGPLLAGLSDEWGAMLIGVVAGFGSAAAISERETLRCALPGRSRAA